MAKEFHQVSAKEIVDKTLHSVKDFAVEGQMEDDVTLICVKRRNS
jgi:serine phosphatase RsbU (regulator of sigma subunit)